MNDLDLLTISHQLHVSYYPTRSGAKITMSVEDSIQDIEWASRPSNAVEETEIHFYVCRFVHILRTPHTLLIVGCNL
jgi:hypothetical protein